jgi:hypothetical protein
MLSALVLHVATVGRFLAAVVGRVADLAPYVALAVPLAAVSAFTYLLLARRVARRRTRRRTRATLAKLAAAMEAELDAAMAAVSAQLAAIPPERCAALGWPDPRGTRRHPAGARYPEES